VQALRSLKDALVAALGHSVALAGGGGMTPGAGQTDVSSDQRGGLSCLDARDVVALVDAMERAAAMKPTLLRALVGDVQKLAQGLASKDTLGAYW
jgi:hypothetical protein